jgi:hypothetical protein
MVKCADCGYLGAREVNSHQLVNPRAEQRQTGAPSRGNRNGLSVALTRTDPICAIAAFDLQAEMGNPGAGAFAEAAVAEVITKDRKCNRFTDNMPALTPKEHIEMNMLEEQREWQLRCQSEDQKHHRNELWILGGFVGVCTLIAGACNIIAAILTRH